MVMLIRSHWVSAIATMAVISASSMVAISPVVAQSGTQDEVSEPSGCELVDDTVLRADCYHAEGLAAYERGELQAAIESYTMALQVNPRHGDSYYNRGVAHYDLGYPEDAIADYSQAIALNTQDEDAYYNRGLARYDLGDTQGAMADFNATLSINPDARDAQGWLDYIQYYAPDNDS